MAGDEIPVWTEKRSDAVGCIEVAMSSDSKKAPGHTTLHPAVAIVGAFAVAGAGENVWPLDSSWRVLIAFQNIGKGLVVSGMVALIFAYGLMARSRTAVDPRKHTTRIVTTGIYRFSRNPIYLGWFLVMLGAGLEKLSLFYVVTSLVMISVLQWPTIRRIPTMRARTARETWRPNWCQTGAAECDPLGISRQQEQRFLRRAGRCVKIS